LSKHSGGQAAASRIADLRGFALKPRLTLSAFDILRLVAGQGATPSRTQNLSLPCFDRTAGKIFDLLTDAPTHRMRAVSGGRVSKAPPLQHRGFRFRSTGTEVPPLALSPRTASSSGCGYRLELCIDLARACPLRVPRDPCFHSRAHGCFHPVREAHLFGTGSTLSSRPWSGLGVLDASSRSPDFPSDRVSHVAMAPVSVSPKLIEKRIQFAFFDSKIIRVSERKNLAESCARFPKTFVKRVRKSFAFKNTNGMGRTGHCSPERPLQPDELHYEHPATA